jgi:acetyl esterase
MELRKPLKEIYIIIYLISFCLSLPCYAQKDISNPKTISFSQLMDGSLEAVTYKNVNGKALHLYIARPGDFQRTDKRTAMIIIHGGGWTGGDVSAFFPHARYFASRGAVSFCVEYRLVKKGESTVANCVMDCKSAVRYIRAHAKEFGIDPEKIVVMGDSAGGHLSACMGTVLNFNESTDNLKISDCPNMAILCNPLSDFTESSFVKLIEGKDSLEIKSLAKALSPLYNVRKNKIRTLIMHGTADKVISPLQSEALCKAMKGVGNSCDLILLPNANHAFVCVKWRASEAEVVKVIRQIDAYMCRNGFLKGASNLVTSVPEAWKPIGQVTKLNRGMHGVVSNMDLGICLVHL